MRGLIRAAWYAANGNGHPQIRPHISDPLINEFRHAVLAGLSDVPRIPGAKHSAARHGGGTCWSYPMTSGLT